MLLASLKQKLGVVFLLANLQPGYDALGGQFAMLAVLLVLFLAVGACWGALVGALIISTLRTGVVLMNIPFIPADNFEAIVGVTIVAAAILIRQSLMVLLPVTFLTPRAYGHVLLLLPLLGFFNNDPTHPVILGSLYSSKRAPPYALEAENNTKAIVTRAKSSSLTARKPKPQAAEDSSKRNSATPTISVRLRARVVCKGASEGAGREASELPS